MSTETIGLKLDLSDSSAVAKQLTVDLEAMKVKVNEVGASYARGEMNVQEFIKQHGQLSGSINQTKGLIDGLTGKPGGGGGNMGQGLLGASYAVQDFTSQLGTRGLVGALGAIQNNIPQILMSLGAGAGLTGVISVAAVALGALLPLLSKAFGGETQEQIDAAKKKVEEFTEGVKKAHEAFLNMTVKPTTAEEESAASIKAILEDRPNAKRAANAISSGIGERTALAELSPEEMEKVGGINKRIMNEDQIRAMPMIGDPAQIETFRAQARRDSEKAEQERHELLLKARQRIGERTLQDAVKAGPEGNAARRRLTEYAPADIKREIEGSSPEAQRKWEAELDSFEAGNEDYVRHRDARKAKKAKQKKRDEDVRDAELDASSGKKEIEDVENKEQRKLMDEQAKDAQDRADAAKKERADTTTRLGDDWIAQAQRGMLEAGPKGQQHAADFVTRSAQQRLQASGMDAGQAAVRAAGIHQWLNSDIGRQLQQNGQGNGQRGQMALHEGLGRNLALNGKSLNLVDGVVQNQKMMADKQNVQAGQIERNTRDVRRLIGGPTRSCQNWGN